MDVCDLFLHCEASLTHFAIGGFIAKAFAKMSMLNFLYMKCYARFRTIDDTKTCHYKRSILKLRVSSTLNLHDVFTVARRLKLAVIIVLERIKVYAL